MTRTKTRTRKYRQRGRGFDIQKLLGKTGIEFHWPGYQYMGPGTKLAKRLKRGDPGINRLDKIAKQHNIDYSHAKNLQDKWKADTKMIKAITRLPGNKTVTEKIVKRIMQFPWFRSVPQLRRVCFIILWICQHLRRKCCWGWSLSSGDIIHTGMIRNQAQRTLVFAEVRNKQRERFKCCCGGSSGKRGNGYARPRSRTTENGCQANIIPKQLDRPIWCNRTCS